jgi:tight adherence protein B
MSADWSSGAALVPILALALVAVLVWPGRQASGGGRSGRGREVGVTEPRGRGRRASRAVTAAEDRLADLLGLVAAPLRAGVPASTSLAAAAPAVEDDPVLDPLVHDLVAAGASGEPVSVVWLTHGQALGSDALRFVGQAWALSDRTGAPLADALKASEEVLRARTRSRQRLASAAAGPRASMGVLALLPLSGPVVGLACGVGLRDLYFTTALSTVSLLAGIGFAALGWWWSRTILERAM